MRKSKTFDIITTIFTYLAGFISMGTLFVIIGFTLINGLGLLSWDLLTGNYYAETISINMLDITDFSYEEYDGEIPNDTYYSEKWGFALSDTYDLEGNSVITITYIADSSPLYDAMNYDGSKADEVLLESEISVYVITDNGIATVSKGAENMINVIDGANSISDLQYTTPSGGIRGSLITTCYLIVITLIIVVPFGILASIYINEYAKKGRFVNILCSMIDMLTGVPSIIFGLLGAALFIPFVNNLTGVEGSFGSIYAGALTMSVILLPTIIKTTIEGLKTVPSDLRSASLALGASNTQTTFKVVLPNSIVGITSGVILAIGRIVGESAALIFAMGTLISDTVSLDSRSTTLAVHIWTVMQGETQNFELASSIALIILIFVLSINLSIKLLSKKLNKFS